MRYEWLDGYLLGKSNVARVMPEVYGKKTAPPPWGPLSDLMKPLAENVKK